MVRAQEILELVGGGVVIIKPDNEIISLNGG